MAHPLLRFFSHFFPVVILALLVLSCPNPLSSTNSTTSSSNSTEGSITITIQNNINAKTLAPGISMTPVSYNVLGTGPFGSSLITAPITNGVLTVNSLLPGSWSLTVYAWNAANGTGTNIGMGQATVLVVSGQVATANITVVPLAGPGTLNLTSNWSGYPVTSISASLTPIPSGTMIPLSFTFSPAGNSAALTTPNLSMSAGYYNLSLILNDGNLNPPGTSDVVRIVKGQTTSGNYAFNATNGNMTVTINPSPQNPIVLGSISGIPSGTIYPGTSFSVHVAATDGTTNASYSWSLNGVPLSPVNETTTSLGSSCILTPSAAGNDRIDVVAISSDGTRAGSQTIGFLVNPTSNPPYISAMIFGGVTGVTGAQSVKVLNNTPANNGQPILNAAVVVNGNGFSYNSSSGSYVGNLNIAAGTLITVNVSVNGVTYIATAAEFFSYPSILAPTAGTTWSSGASNDINWSVSAPTAPTYAIVGIQDNNNSNNWIFPASNGPQFQLIPATDPPAKSTNIPAGTLAQGGSYTVIAGIANGTGNNGTMTGGTAFLPAPLAGSGMIVGGAASVQITTSGAALATPQAATFAQTVVGSIMLVQNASSLWTVNGANVSYSPAGTGLSMSGTSSNSGSVNNFNVTITYSGYSDAATGYTISGGTLTYSGTNDSSTNALSERVTATNLNSSGGLVTSSTWNVNVSGNNQNPSISGSVICNNTSFQAGTLSLPNAPQANTAFQALRNGISAVLNNSSQWTTSGTSISYSTTGLSMTGTLTSTVGVAQINMVITYAGYAAGGNGYTVSGTANYAASDLGTSGTLGTVTLQGVTLSGGQVATMSADLSFSSPAPNHTSYSGTMTANGVNFDARTFSQ